MCARHVKKGSVRVVVCNGVVACGAGKSKDRFGGEQG